MEKKSLIILNNEKVFKEKNNFFCDNLDLKVVPEELNKFFKVKYLVRSSNKKGGQQINLKDIQTASNIFKFIYNLLKTFKIDSKYLIISVTPYTFIAYLFLLLFNKKVYLYLWSDGHEEWRYLLGNWSVWIFHFMYLVCTFRSEIIVCNKRLAKKKSHLISISRLEELWFKDLVKTSLDQVNFLYVGRISKEKGIYDFLKMFENLKMEKKMSIVGYSKNFKSNNSKINLLGYISDPKTLINIYDQHNITILPSYTEGYPYVIDESLARKRPVVIFEEISYVINNKKGIFIAKRNLESLTVITNYILQNYEKIQDEMNENKLPTKNSMIKQISEIIKI